MDRSNPDAKNLVQPSEVEVEVRKEKEAWSIRAKGPARFFLLLFALLLVALSIYYGAPFLK